jgi:hypothetical protein
MTELLPFRRDFCAAVSWRCCYEPNEPFVDSHTYTPTYVDAFATRARSAQAVRVGHTS